MFGVPDSQQERSGPTKTHRSFGISKEAMSARDSAQKARNASRKLQALPTEQRVAMLHRIADALVANEEAIMAENKKVLGTVFDSLVSAVAILILCRPWHTCCLQQQ